MSHKKDISEIKVSVPTISESDAKPYLDNLNVNGLGFLAYTKDNCSDIILN